MPIFLQKKKVVHILEKSTLIYIPTNDSYRVEANPADSDYPRDAFAYLTDLKEPPMQAFPNLYFWTHSPGGKKTSFLTNARVYTMPLRSEEHTSELQSLMRISY